MSFRYKIILFVIIFMSLDNIIYYSINYFSKNNITDVRIENILDGNFNYDLVIIGSSRAARNINAGVIEEYSGITSYNLGRPGSNVDYHNFLLKLILKYKEKPKYLLLVIDGTTIIPDPSLSFRYDLIYQFSDYIYIKNFLIERDQLNKYLSMISRSYTMKHSFLETFKPHKFILGKNPLYEVGKDGSMNLLSNGREVEFSQNEKKYDKKNESEYLKNKFLEIISLCKSNGIELYLIITPEFSKPSIGFKERMQVVSGLNTPIFDYRNKKSLMIKEYYNDLLHLNILGAKEFSKAIALDLIRVHPEIEMPEKSFY